MSAALGVPVAHDRRRDLQLSWWRIRAIARRHAYVLRRSPHRLFDVTLWPLVDVLLFGSLAVYVAKGHHGTSLSVYGYLLTGIVLWHVIYQSQIALSTGLLEETWSRNILNLMATPLTEMEYIAGVVLFSVVKLFIGVGVVVLAAVAFYTFHIWDLGWGLVPVVAILLVVGWEIALFVIGIVLRFGSGAEALAWGIMFVVMPLSGVFFPIQALPRFLHPIALALPTTHAFIAARALLGHHGVEWGQLGIAAATTAGLFVASVWFVVAMLRLFRRRGYVTRYS